MSFLTKLKKPKVTRMLGGALGLLLVLSLVLIPVPALAVKGIPHWFHGTVTIDGELAPVGTIISARIGGIEYASTTVDADSRYGEDPLFYVPGDDPDKPGKEGGVNGDTVEFYIGLDEVKANETAVFKNFGVTELNLTVGEVLDTTPPTVLSTTPEADATDVAVDVVVSATFSEGIQAGDNFGGIAISEATGVSTSIDGAILTIAHDAFDYGTLYTVTIPAGAVNDLADNPLATAEVWSFTTMVVDITPPTVVSTIPEPGATASIDVVVSATFDEAIDEEATLVFTLDSVAGSVAGTPSYDSGTKTATFTPEANLDYDITYTASIQASDLAGNPMAAAHTWSFTTVVNNPPTVSEPSPADQATNVSTSPQLSVLASDLDEDLMAVTFYDASDDSVIGTVEGAATGTRHSVTWAGLDYGVQYSWYVKVSDAINLEVTSDTWSFTIRAEGPVSFPVTLSAGWNTFSTPIALDPCTDTWDELQEVSELDILIIYGFDVSTGYWALITGGPVEPLEGFYVNMGSEGTVSIVPNPEPTPPPTKELSTGLNLIGPASLVDRDVVSSLIDIYELTGGLIGYSRVLNPPINVPNDFVDDAYVRNDPVVPTIVVGKAYWVIMINPGTLYGFSSTPIE